MTDNMNDNELDRLFREKFAEEEASPPDFTWPNIERALDKPVRRPGGWYWWLSGIVLLFLGMGTWWMLRTTTANPAAAEKQLAQTETNSLASASERKNEAPAELSSSENQSSPAQPGQDRSTASNEPAAVPATNPAAAIQPGQESKTAKQAEARSTGTTAGGKPNASTTPKPVSSPVKPGKEQRSVSSSSSEGTAVAKPPVAVGKPASSSGKEPLADPAKEKPEAKETASAGHPGTHLPEIIYDQQNVLGHEAKPETETPLPLLQPGATTENSGSGDPAAKNDSPVVAPLSGESISNEALPVTNPESPAVLPQDAGLSLTEQQHTDSVPGKKEMPPLSQTEETLPVFFAGFHGAMEKQAIASSSSNETGFTYRDVILYKGDTPPVVTQQTYVYGGRFGWFATKHLALVGGISSSTLEIASPGRFVRYNHNDEILFDFHSASASAELSSSNFTAADNYAPMGDTFWVKIVSQEKYSFLHFQLGGSWYPLRTKHFGAYINVLSNGAYLTRQQMTLTSVKTGNVFTYGKENMAGMNSFTIGGQAGIGFEFMPVRNFGIWIEPAYFFSNTINRNNAFNFRPSSVRLQCGLSAHF